MNPAPYLPENAPFTPAQQAWLNGFLAGLYATPPDHATAMPENTMNVVTVDRNCR